jgi:CheY-like chemotaxis protein
MKRLVLIVDGDECSRKALTGLFATLKGWFPITATNGREALAIMAEQKIDLVITEIQMPEVSGLELIQTLRQKSPSDPVIVVVTKNCPLPPNEVLKLGANGFFRKPITRGDLIDQLTTLFAKAA